MLDDHTAPVVTGTINTCSKHSATLYTAKQIWDILQTPSLWKKAFVIHIDTAYLTKAGYLSLTMAATEYAHQPKPELQDNQQQDAGEMSPVPMKWDTLLDEFADVFTEPTQSHPGPI